MTSPDARARIGRTRRPATSAARVPDEERTGIYGILAAAPDGLTQAEITRRVLCLVGPAAGTPALEALGVDVGRLLAEDPRFRREPDGVWRLAVRPCAGGGPYDPSPDTPLDALTFAVVDLETTGCRTDRDRIIEIGGVKVTGGRIVERYRTFVHPGRAIPPFITRLTGIDDAMVEGAPPFRAVVDALRAFVGGTVVVAHNAAFDGRFLEAELSAATGRGLERPLLCTIRVGRRLLAGRIARFDLDTVAGFCGFAFDGRHRALGDAEVTALVLLRFLGRCAEEGVSTWGALRRLTTRRPRVPRRRSS